MKLYCAACNELHEFDVGDLEELVYALQAGEVDQRCEEFADARHDAGKDPFGEEWCLRQALSMGGDCEGYGEVVSANVEARRRLEGEQLGVADAR